MKLLVLSLLLTTSCVIAKLPEERCALAGLSVETLDIQETTLGKQSSKVHCVKEVN